MVYSYIKFCFSVFDWFTDILSVGTALTGAATVTETLTFTVTDDCGNVGTDTLDITITNPVSLVLTQIPTLSDRIK